MSVEGEFFEFGHDADNDNLIWYDPCCGDYLKFSNGCSAVIGQDAETGERMLILKHPMSLIFSVRFCPSCGARARYVEDDEEDEGNDGA